MSKVTWTLKSRSIGANSANFALPAPFCNAPMTEFGGTISQFPKAVCALPENFCADVYMFRARICAVGLGRVSKRTQIYLEGTFMTVPYPRKLEAKEIYSPLLALRNDTLLRPIDVTTRWQVGVDHLVRLRERGAGPAWLRLPGSRKVEDRPTGQIRYRLSDIVAAELDGAAGPLTLARVYLAVSACDFLSEAQRTAVILKLEAALGKVNGTDG